MRTTRGVVTQMFSLVALALIAFLITNVDDLVVLTAFCGHQRYRLQEVLLGQYLGFGLLVGVSIVAGVGVARMVESHVRWLGLLPIAVGVLWFLNTRARWGSARPRYQFGEESTALGRAGVVAGIGLTNGADNIAVYVPLFAILAPGQTMVVSAVFLLAAGLWVLFAQWVSARPPLADRLSEYGDVILPLVLVGLGMAILGDVF